MTSVFVVAHSHEIGDHDEVKFIGVYGTRRDAEAAIARLVDRPGFRQHPAGFHVDEYELGEDHWVDGFSTLVTILVPLREEGVDRWLPVHAEVLPNDHYRIVSEKSGPEDERWAFGTGEVVRCEERVLAGRCELVAVSRVEDADAAREPRSGTAQGLRSGSAR